MSTENDEEKLEYEFSDLLDLGFFRPKDGHKVEVDTDYLAWQLRDKFDKYVEKHLGSGVSDDKKLAENVLVKIERKILKKFLRQIEHYWKALCGTQILPTRIDIDYAAYILEDKMWEEDKRIADAIEEAGGIWGYYSKEFFQALKILLQNQRKQDK